MELLILLAIAAATVPAMLYQTMSNQSVQWIFFGLFLAVAFGVLLAMPVMDNGSLVLGDTVLTQVQFVPIGIGFLLALNFLVVPLIYWVDKRHANYNHLVKNKKKKSSRVPEVAMHTLTALGGAVGAFTSQQVFHHKRNKGSFQIVFFLTILTSMAIYYAIWMALEPDMARLDAWFQNSEIFRDLHLFGQ